MMAALVLQFGQNACRRQPNANPPLRADGVSVKENGQKDTEHFSGGGHSCADQRIEVGNGVENEALSDRGANREVQNLLQDHRIGQTELQP